MSFTSEVLMSEDSLQFKGNTVNSDDYVTLVFRPAYSNKAFKISTGSEYDDYKSNVESNILLTETLIGKRDITTGNLTCDILNVANVFADTITSDSIISINLE